MELDKRAPRKKVQKKVGKVVKKKAEEELKEISIGDRLMPQE